MMANFFFSGRMKSSSIDRDVSLQTSQEALRRPRGRNVLASSKNPEEDRLIGDVS